MTAAAPAPEPLSLLRLPDVIARVGLRKTALYDMVKAGTFPAPIRWGRRAVFWPSDRVENWIRERIAEADAATVREAQR
jgi:prophage regulatory protein